MFDLLNFRSISPHVEGIYRVQRSEKRLPQIKLKVKVRVRPRRNSALTTLESAATMGCGFVANSGHEERTHATNTALLYPSLPSLK